MHTIPDDTDTRPSAESFTQAAAPLRAQQTTGKVKELLEELTRLYGVQTIQLFYRDAMNQEKLWIWDGQELTQTTPLQNLSFMPTTEPSI